MAAPRRNGNESATPIPAKRARANCGLQPLRKSRSEIAPPLMMPTNPAPCRRTPTAPITPRDIPRASTR